MSSDRSPRFDELLQKISEYVYSDRKFSDEAYATARLCLLDSVGCALLASTFAACRRLLGPIVPGAELMGRGARVIGTGFELDPVQAAFNIGSLIRWLDFNDTWLAAEWGHPSDNLGALIAVADFVGRAKPWKSSKSWTVFDLLHATVQAHEIQGVLALTNSFNQVGLDHVLLVRIASTAVSARLLGCTRQQTANALSNAFIDGGALRVYRHAPNTGSRKSWAAGDAAARGVWHALIASRGEMGYRSALSVPTWGFETVTNRGRAVTLSQPFGSYVMENVLFKIAFPAEFHAQTAVEAAFALAPQIQNRWSEIARIIIETQEGAKRIIDKEGPLRNPADRDHCIQYMVAIGLLKGTLTAADYEPAAAADPRIDWLRQKIHVVENHTFSKDYLDPQKRAVPNSVQIFFQDGSQTERIQVDFPVGHRRRRTEGVPLLLEKFRHNVASVFSGKSAAKIMHWAKDEAALLPLTVNEFVSGLVKAR